MIAANEYKEGRSVEWLNLASGINNLELTKELLRELKENPMKMRFIPGVGHVGKLQADAMDALKKWGLNSWDKDFRYQMLGRMKADCEYYIDSQSNMLESSYIVKSESQDNSYEKLLWAKNVNEQIAIMKKLYASFYEWERPEWITLSDIENFKNLMVKRKSQ